MSKLAEALSAWILERPGGGRLSPPNGMPMDRDVGNKILLILLNGPMSRACVGSSVAAVNITLGYTPTSTCAISLDNHWALVRTQKTQVLTRRGFLTRQGTRHAGNDRENEGCGVEL